MCIVKGGLKMRNEPASIGTVKIANEIILNIAGLAALEVDGVQEVLGFSPNAFTDKKPSALDYRGIKMELQDRSVFIDMILVLDKGVKIPEIAHQVQGAVTNQIEVMTGLHVEAVNITVSAMK